MKKYPKYKDSGVSWIGEIPEGWKKIKLKYICSGFSNGTSQTQIDKTEESFPVTRIETISTGSINFDKVGYVKKFDNLENYRLFKNDILISNINSYERVGNCAIIKSDRPLYHGMNLIKVTPKDIINVDYLLDYFRSEIFLFNMRFMCKPAINQVSVSATNLKNILIPYPTLSEQQAIVSYLDKKSSQIDRFIVSTEAEIEALKELKQAEIARLVTRGVNPDVPMKDSGIAWIGEIPEYWEVSHLRKYLKLISEKGHGSEQLLSVTREQGVIVRNVDSKEENHNFVPDDLNGYKFVEEGQFVINKMKSWQGSYGVSLFRGIASPAYFVCDLDFRNKEFFNIAIRSKAYVPFFTQYSKGIRVDQWDLSPIALKNIPFIAPPVEEQSAIVSAIDTLSSKIDHMVEQLDTQISHLKELKQRIISDAVTGKIDVSLSPALPSRGER